MLRASFLVFMFISFFAQAQVQSSAYDIMLKTLLAHSVQEVSVAHAEKMSNVYFLDAREPAEFAVSHIKDAIGVGYSAFDWNEVKAIEKDRKIVVYCSVGYRSEKIAERLKAAGYTNVYNLYGGIFEWVNQGNPVVDTNQNITSNIHAYSKTWGIWLNKGTKIYE